MLVDTSDWFLNDAIQLEGVQALGREDLVSQLRAQFQASPYRSLTEIEKVVLTRGR